MRKKCLVVLVALLGLCVYGAPAGAMVLDFYDNVAAPPGFYTVGYFNYYDAPKLKDDSGHTVKTATGQDLDLKVTLGAVRPVYYFKALNNLFALNAIIPFGEVEQRNFTTGRKQTSNGIGDIQVGPAVFLLQDEKSGTFLSYWPFISMATGNYSESRAMQGGANLGLGYWYLQHQLCFATSFYEKSPWSYDMNVNLYQKFDTSKLKPGDAMEIEGILGYGITDKFRLGAYATYYFDLEKSEYFGASSGKRTFFSGGPAIAYLTEKWGINLRWVYDFDAENGPKGNQFWLKFAYAF